MIKEVRKGSSDLPVFPLFLILPSIKLEPMSSETGIDPVRT